MQIYGGIFAMQLYWNHTSAELFSKKHTVTCSLSLSSAIIHQFHSCTKKRILIAFMSTPSFPHSPHSQPNLPHSHPDFPHSHPDSHYSHPDPPHSHPDSHHSTPIPRIPTPNSRIPTLIARIPRIPIIPFIPFSDFPFRVLQIAF